ncbi:MAG: heat-inducible transcriptional repressor HrcA [Salinisphaera sp.]|nr:heat-inducible transcriptional repressor HrcA [Salinisphaera sp.]
MTEQTEHEQLDPRAQLLLKTLVERYIREGQPVGSRLLAKSSGLSLSAATVRNVMADLEDMGFVAAPHTSAGRVPTVRGYRLFVDSLLAPEPISEQVFVSIERQLRVQADSGGDLLASASLLLSSLSDMAGVVTVPRTDSACLRRIEFLPLSDRRVLAILVVNQHEVQNRILEAERDYSAVELEAAAQRINERFSGQDLFHIRRALVAELHRAQDDVNQGLLAALAIAQAAFGQPASERRDYVLAGQTNLMGFPEFSEVDRLRRLFDAFQQKRDLLALFDDCLSADGLRIFIGDESGYRVLDECSVVSAPYSVDGEVVGTLGVIGPTRMAYHRIIPLVDATASLLGSVLKNVN